MGRDKLISLQNQTIRVPHRPRSVRFPNPSALLSRPASHGCASVMKLNVAWALAYSFPAAVIRQRP